ncbi:YwdI family protein [Actinomycetes bacterium NPDC127524]
MDISSGRVLAKMEDMITKAKFAESQDKLIGYAIAIQALCEVLIDDNEHTDKRYEVTARADQQLSLYTGTQVTQSPSPVSMPQTKPVKMEDANGDSLFDF